MARTGRPRGPWPVRTQVERLVEEVMELRHRLAELERRPWPTEVREWRPDHRRIAEGGTPVRAQRREVGLPRRPR